MGVPLAMDMASSEIQEVTGNELIINRPGEIEERKGPSMAWPKVNMYTTYALRGFGSFNVPMGRCLFGLESPTSLSRRANTPRHRSRGLKIRTPVTNRLTNGIALAPWGGEDGREGRKDAILLNDCFPLGSIDFDRFGLADGIVGDHGRPPSTMYMFIERGR